MHTVPRSLPSVFLISTLVGALGLFPSQRRRATERNQKYDGHLMSAGNEGEQDHGLVSVIIACYNCENTIDACLASVYAQEYRPIQVCIHDDGSSDTSTDLIRHWLNLSTPGRDSELKAQLKAVVDTKSEGEEDRPDDVIAALRASRASKEWVTSGI